MGAGVIELCVSGAGERVMKSETIWFGCLDAEERAMVSWVMRLGIFGVGKHYMEYQSRADLIELQSLIKNTADFNKKIGIPFWVLVRFWCLWLHCKYTVMLPTMHLVSAVVLLTLLLCWCIISFETNMLCCNFPSIDFQKYFLKTDFENEIF